MASLILLILSLDSLFFPLGSEQGVRALYSSEVLLWLYKGDKHSKDLSHTLMFNAAHLQFILPFSSNIHCFQVSTQNMNEKAPQNGVWSSLYGRKLQGRHQRPKPRKRSFHVPSAASSSQKAQHLFLP